MIDRKTVLTVPGKPIGKPRMTQRDKWMKRPEVVRYREYSDAIRIAAGLDLLATLIDAEIHELDLEASFVPPKSWSAKKRDAAIGSPHTKKPDGDNIFKSVGDSLFADDSKIHTGSFRKVWGESEFTTITIIYTEH